MVEKKSGAETLTFHHQLLLLAVLWALTVLGTADVPASIHWSHIKLVRESVDGSWIKIFFSDYWRLKICVNPHQGESWLWETFSSAADGDGLTFCDLRTHREYKFSGPICGEEAECSLKKAHYDFLVILSSSLCYIDFFDNVKVRQSKKNPTISGKGSSSPEAPKLLVSSPADTFRTKITHKCIMLS